MSEHRAMGRYLTNVIWGALVIAGIAAAAIWVAGRTSTPLGIAAAVVLSVAAAVQSFRVGIPSLLLAGILGLAAGALAAMEAGQPRDALAGALLHDAPLRAAYEQPEATRFRFQDARVRDDLRSTIRASSSNPSTGQRTETVHHAAPIVDAHWTPDDPVWAWAVASGQSIHLEDWNEPFRAAVRLSSFAPEEEYRKAIAQSGLRSPPDAALLVWVADPDAAVQGWRDGARFTIKVFTAVWLVLMLVIVPSVRLILRRRAAASGRGPTQSV
ncbi:MAG: hypothetical protein K9N49_03130 [Candidatus Marinimicrobia bacterium]|nr:hypothetical protein [Candidatus Neomarinimicrobiota bacterium]